VWDTWTLELHQGCVADDEATVHVRKIEQRNYRREYRRISEAMSRARSRGDDSKAELLKSERDSLRDQISLPRGRPTRPALDRPVQHPR
jgi:hypothetical protein